MGVFAKVKAPFVLYAYHLPWWNQELDPSTRIAWGFDSGDSVTVATTTFLDRK
jgi:hypothetical protein